MTVTPLTFSRGDHSEFSSIECHNEATQLSYVTGRRANAKSARMQVHAGDTFGNAPGDRILACRYDTHEQPGMTRWHRFSCKWPTNDGLVWERHTPHPGLDNDAALGVAPLAILRNYNRMVLRLFAGDGKPGQGFPVQMSPGPPGQGRHEEMVLVPSPVTTWMDFKLMVKYSEGSDGALDLWVDPTGQNKVAAATRGAPFFSYRGVTCEFSTALGLRNIPLYACMGLYIDWSRTEAGEVIHDGEHYAATEAEVDAPYGAAVDPTAIPLTKHASGDGNVIVSWQPVSGAQGYYFYEDGKLVSRTFDPEHAAPGEPPASVKVAAGVAFQVKTVDGIGVGGHHGEIQT